ncbi:MAG: hypothetical protein WBM90_05355, partial [Acidimicrobiia bacterium]
MNKRRRIHGIFPSGRFPTPRQAWVVWPGAIMLSIQVLVAAFTAEIGPPYPPEELAWTVDNPIGFLPGSVLVATIALTVVVLLAMAIGGVASLTRRYRRSSVVAKAQTRWMLFSTMILGGAILLIAVTDASQTAAGALILQVAFVSIPISITVAITRYRLFEIDRIISRTVSYAVVVIVL